MRILKFRTPVFGHTTGKFLYYGYTSLSKGGIISSDFSMMSNDCVVGDYEQFTGRYDKNGVEIYHNDILATSNDDSEYDLWTKEDSGYTTVLWDEENDCWNGSDWNFCDYEESIFSLKFVEVVGNKHTGAPML